jgi:hypothetical protein
MVLPRAAGLALGDDLTDFDDIVGSGISRQPRIDRIPGTVSWHGRYRRRGRPSPTLLMSPKRYSDALSEALPGRIAGSRI